MIEVLSFPGLGLEIPINRVALHVGPFTIYWYGILFALAFAAGVFYVVKACKPFGVNPDKMFDVLLFAFIGGVVGARIYYVIFSWDMYKNDLMAVFRIWEGGIAIYGGVIGAFLAGYIMCRIRKVKILPAFDVGVIGLLLGQAIGRWGNFVNMEAFGANTTLPWGMTSPSIVNYLSLHKASLAALGVQVMPAVPVHPTFIYESLWNLLGFALFAFVLSKRRRFDGQMLLSYAMWYGIGRFFIEGLRTDSLMIVGLRVSQGLALISFLAAGIVMLYIYGKIRENGGDPDYLKVYGKTEAGILDAEDDGSKKTKAAEEAKAEEEKVADDTAKDTTKDTTEAEPAKNGKAGEKAEAPEEKAAEETAEKKAASVPAEKEAKEPETAAKPKNEKPAPKAAAKPKAPAKPKAKSGGKPKEK